MKTFFLILLLSLPLSFVFAQTSVADSVTSRIQKYDTAFQKSKDKISAVQGALDQKKDSLQKKYQAPLSKLDSIQTSFKQQADSIKGVYQSRFSKLDSITNKLRHKTDSLKTLNLPTEKYTHKLDSINQLQQQAIAKAEEKLEKLKAKTTEKLKAVELPPDLQSKITDATKSIDGVKLPQKGLSVASLNIDNPLGKLGNGNLKNPLNGIGGVDNLTDVGKLPQVSEELKDLQSGMKDVNKLTGEAGQYQKDVQNITKGNLDQVKQLPNDLENKAANLTGVDKLQGETKAFDQYKDQMTKLQDPNAMKQEVVEKARQVAIDHFAGKEQVLQQAMENMSKYKQKYTSLQSLEDAKKKRPNEMRNKPIRERLLPGIGLQVHHKNDLLVDVNPYLGYRFTGRLTSGMGWNQRWAYTEKNDSFNPKGMVFGPRAYAEYDLARGFFPRLEIEAMNAFIPTALNLPTTDNGHRQWIWSAFGGLKKKYRFLKTVNGTSAIMFNLYNPKRKSPYADVVNIRFGFEFPIKKKASKKP